MSEETDALTSSEAEELLDWRDDDDEDKVVHSFLSLPGVLIGADISVRSVRKEMRKWPVQRSGPAASGMQHGVVIVRPDDKGGSIFLATKEAK